MFELYAYDNKTRVFYPTMRFMFYSVEQAKALYREKHGLKHNRLDFRVQATEGKKMNFLEYLNNELFSQDWLELFEAYNDRNKYGFLIFGSFDQLLDEYYTDHESLKKALSQGVFEDINRDAWLYVVDDCERISAYISTYDLVEDLAGYQALADFAEENDLPIWQEYKEQVEEN